MSLEIVVTNAGRAALVNGQNSGTNPVTITEVGLSSTAVTPLPALTVLAGEFKRVNTVSGEVAADDIIHLSMLDSSGDSYTLRSIGVYLADGTLFAVYGQPAAILEKTASSTGALQVDIIFADISAAMLTFGDTKFLNPPATTERQGVVELATVAEAQAGIDALRALTPAGGKAAILGWLLSQDGSGSGIDSDLLDGQHGSYYADIIARLGYSPVDRAGDTMTGPLTLPGAPTGNLHAASKQYIDGLVTAAALLAKLLTVDGSGSGVDSDLLDGQHGSYYTAIAARLGYAPLDKAGDTITGRLSLLDAANFLDKDTSGYPLWQWDISDFMRFLRDLNTLEIKIANQTVMLMRGSSGALDLYSSGIWRNGSKVWDAGNDGSGSGLDTDFFRGHDLDKFRRVTSSGQNANGRWRKYSDGTIEMEGVKQISVGANITTTRLTFPVTVDNGQLARVMGSADRPANNTWTPIACMFVSADATGCTIYADSCNVSQTLQGGINVNWRAFTA